MNLRQRDPWDQLARAARDRTQARLAILRVLLVLMFVALTFALLVGSAR